MQDSVAAIRASRSRARFVLPPAHRRERHLGLHRLSRTPAVASTLDARAQPLKALRTAARRLITTPSEIHASGFDVLRREPRMRWSADERSRTRSAAPWRG